MGLNMSAVLQETRGGETSKRNCHTFKQGAAEKNPVVGVKGISMVEGRKGWKIVTLNLHSLEQRVSTEERTHNKKLSFRSGGSNAAGL